MSWEQLKDILAEEAHEREQAEFRPPVECPCGLPLEQGPRGILFCSFSGHQWPRDAALFIR